MQERSETKIPILDLISSGWMEVFFSVLLPEREKKFRLFGIKKTFLFLNANVGMYDRL